MTALKLPYYCPGSQIGCLLIHGFTSTPAELRLIAQNLSKAGYTTHGILLAGHGTEPEDLLHINYEDWIESAQQGINHLKKHCKKIIVIGHSLGGLLALQMAARNKIDGVVTIAAALKPTNRKTRLAWFLKHFRTYTSLPSKKSTSEQQKYLLHYPYFPIRAVAELQKLANHTKGILSQITTDALIIQTSDDQTVRPESADIIQRKLSSTNKECFWLEEGTHSAPAIIPTSNLISEKIITFIDALT